MRTVINYELLKEVVSREETIIREELCVEDVGNFCVEAFTEKGVKELFAINTDQSGMITSIKVKDGKLEFKHKEHYDINFIISSTQAFLKNHPTVHIITKKVFKEQVNEFLSIHFVLTPYNNEEI